MNAANHRTFHTWLVNPLYSAHWKVSNASNDAADEIIDGHADKHLLTQDQLFEAQGGWATVGLASGAVVLGTAAVFIGGPRTAQHFKTGSCSWMEWACLGSSAVFWWSAGHTAGRYMAGDVQKANNHWLAYKWVKSQNRFEGRTILTKGGSY